MKINIIHNNKYNNHEYKFFIFSNRILHEDNKRINLVNNERYYIKHIYKYNKR